MTVKRMSAAVLAAATLGAGLAVVTPSAANANEDDVIRRGNCTNNATWKLKVGPEDGRLEVEGEVDVNRNGQVWAWRIVHNGSVSARGTATTVAPSGSFEVERRVVDLAGTDKIVFRAERNGQVCRGVVNY